MRRNYRERPTRLIVKLITFALCKNIRQKSMAGIWSQKYFCIFI